MVFNPTFTDKLYHIMLYTFPWAGFELTTSVVIGTDCIGSCKSNYDMITATTATNLVCTTRFWNNLHQVRWNPKYWKSQNLLCCQLMIKHGFHRPWKLLIRQYFKGLLKNCITYLNQICQRWSWLDRYFPSFVSMVSISPPR